MAAVDIESVIKKGVEQAMNKPILNGKSVLEWAEIGIHSQEQPQWISVKDRLPEQSGYVLTCYGDYHIINVFSYSKKHRAFNAHDCLPTAENNVDVTHWMPLPEPPEEVAKAE
jgi:hypothetical protein